MNNNINQCPEFPHFGARYPDATCIDGFLWDLDSAEDVDGHPALTRGGDDPCPFCNTEAYIGLALDEKNDVTREKILESIEKLKERYGQPPLD